MLMMILLRPDRGQSAAAPGRGRAGHLPRVPRHQGAADLRQRRARGQDQARQEAAHRDRARTRGVPLDCHGGDTLNCDKNQFDYG